MYLWAAAIKYIVMGERQEINFYHSDLCSRPSTVLFVNQNYSNGLNWRGQNTNGPLKSPLNSNRPSIAFILITIAKHSEAVPLHGRTAQCASRSFNCLMLIQSELDMQTDVEHGGYVNVLASEKCRASTDTVFAYLDDHGESASLERPV